MNRRDFLKRLGLLPLVLPLLKPFEGEPIETTLPPIEPKQELNVETRFCFSGPYYGHEDIESFYKALDALREKGIDV
jgi:hypothetical protein